VPERPVWRAAIGTALFLLVAPGSVLGGVPWLILRWSPTPVLPGWLRWAGLIPLVPGAVLLVDSFVRFVTRGRGTPAPIAPPSSLVVTGFYRWVRNPMYVAIVLVVLGEALLFRSPALLLYAAVLWLTFHLFVLLYEEPHLRGAFGQSYDQYVRSVPRWIPLPPRVRSAASSAGSS
jgi:protein-S-isoprenylcysteine O-methyltransferase Ste14